jgi:hypothetical protein
MYEALTGDLPFSANTPQGLMLHHIHTRPASPLKRRADLKLPEALVEMAMKALEKNPALRFESAGAMAAALEEFQEAQPASAARFEPARPSSFAGGVPAALRPPAPEPVAAQMTPPALLLGADEEEPAPDSDSLPLVDLDEVLKEAPLPMRAEAAGSSTLAAEARPRLSRPAERAGRSGSAALNPLLSPGLADLDLDEISPALALAGEEDEGGVEAMPVPEVASEPPTTVLVESPAKSRAEPPPQQGAPQPLTPVTPALPTGKDRPAETRSQNRSAADVMAATQPVERVRNLSPAPFLPTEPPRGRTLQEPAKLPVSKIPAEPLPARSSTLGLSITEVTSREVEPPAGKHRARTTAIAAGVILCAAAGTWWALQKSRHASLEPAEEAVSAPAPGAPPPVASPSPAAETPATPAPKETPSAVNSSLPPASLAPPSAPAAVTAQARNESSHTPRVPLPTPSASARTSAAASRNVSKVASVPARSTTTKAARAAPALSPAQQAELKDKLVVAGFLMERGDYDGALDSFEAALKIDASNRDAQAGKKAARQARDAEKTNAQ